MYDFLKKTLLNDRFILVVILINSVIIYLQESGFNNPVILSLDIICTLVFIVEMITKHVHYGVKGYWSNGWNRMDGILVIISLPSLITPFINVETFNFSVLLTLRLMRVLRSFRMLHFFPNIAQVLEGLKRALRDSGVVLVSFLIFVFIFGLINCSLFKDVAPEYFGNPLQSIYSAFRVFTVEGWYEIPDAISSVTSPMIGRMTRIYFCVIFFSFGILGLSLINSVFVDAMVADNNDDIKEQLKRMEEKIDKLTKKEKTE
ncbi:MAG: ion transporter [Paludibacteraceae bacterium]|nr:ion transporter [Paludibacteraceae bacterium]